MCRKVGACVGRTDAADGCRVTCMDLGDGVWSFRNVHVGCGKCLEVGTRVRRSSDGVRRSGHVYAGRGMCRKVGACI